MKYWRFRPNTSDDAKLKIGEAFGKVTWRFSETEFWVDWNGIRSSTPYRVIAKDQVCVVIGLGKDPDPNLEYLRFEDDHFFILSTNHNLEFFTRVGA